MHLVTVSLMGRNAKTMSHFICPLLILFALAPQDSKLRINPKKDAAQVEVSVELSRAVADKMAAGRISQDDGEELLQLCLVLGGKPGPAMLGSYQRDGLKLVFVPRVPLQPDKTYQAAYLQAGKTVATAQYTVPSRPARPPTEVVAVWPTNDVLPANHL